MRNLKKLAGVALAMSAGASVASAAPALEAKGRIEHVNPRGHHLTIGSQTYRYDPRFIGLSLRRGEQVATRLVDAGRRHPTGDPLRVGRQRLGDRHGRLGQLSGRLVQPGQTVPALDGRVLAAVQLLLERLDLRRERVGRLVVLDLLGQDCLGLLVVAGQLVGDVELLERVKKD